MTECIFCRIAKKEIDVPILAETPQAFVIKDRAPVAAEHLLVVSKVHVADFIEAANGVIDMTADGERGVELEPLRAVLWLARSYAREHLPNGFRIVINTGSDAGQTVRHFHVHVLGGEKLPDMAGGG